MVKPKILLLFEYGTLNGGEFSMLAMLEAMGQIDFEFVAAAPHSGMLKQRLEQCSIKVLPLELRDKQGQKMPVEQINSHLIKLITQVSPDLVHSNSLSMGRMVGRVAEQLPIRCTAHLRDIISLNKTAISDLNRNAGFIAVSNATRDFHAGQGIQPDRMQVIYNGVDTHRFRPAQAAGFLRRQLNLSDNSILIANIGQICLRKGQTLLAQAAVHLADEFPQTNYLVIGKRYSQKQESIDYENAIRIIFREGGIEDRFFCLGFREDIPAILNEIDLLVHTAHQEPLGRVLLEAASCGKAIVATKVGGTAEILTDQVSAILIPPDNLDALTAAIRRMLTESELRTSLGNKARDTIIKKFSIPTAAAQVNKFWKAFL